MRSLVPEEAAVRIREGGPLVTSGNVGLRRLQARGQRGAEAPAVPEAALRARPVRRVTRASLPPELTSCWSSAPADPALGAQMGP